MEVESVREVSVSGHWRWAYLLFAACLLATPLVAMQFTREVRWTGSDFLVFGAMLAGLGLLLEMAVRFGSTPRKRMFMASTAAAAFLLLWVELAVGILD
ncbi:hypothetical protein [Parerythrobacter jejuensis]|uniref:Uncharacterized protein n=1 Tax=Parerythrobacter jejuensis TaxID=795812 RepID=A0A845AM42_9SPHN|nr:hypothetical protein [Parerythrobacter jejuensis]MXP30487.1 hypothetical protein [Parerythrobacter jejuensis]MXP33247.1 hypothetical protein [Parerythrobacter jejuensis]